MRWRKFFDALIAENYPAAQKIADKANLVVAEFDADERKDLKKLRQQVKFLRIVEIGKPVPNHEAKELGVPIKLEYEMKIPRQIGNSPPLSAQRTDGRIDG